VSGEASYSWTLNARYRPGEGVSDRVNPSGKTLQDENILNAMLRNKIGIEWCDVVINTPCLERQFVQFAAERRVRS
jgi:hypothetical protein